MNLLNKIPEGKQQQPQPTHSAYSDSLNLDLNYLLKPINNQNSQHEENHPLQDTSDDFLVDISDEKMLDVEKLTNSETPKRAQQEQPAQPEQPVKADLKLNDIFVKLEYIKPSSYPPRLVLDEKNGVSVTLHLAKDKPKEGVSVYVITTINKNELPLSNYLFQAVVTQVSIQMSLKIV